MEELTKGEDELLKTVEKRKNQFKSLVEKVEARQKAEAEAKKLVQQTEIEERVEQAEAEVKKRNETIDHGKKLREVRDSSNLFDLFDSLLVLEKRFRELYVQKQKGLGEENKESEETHVTMFIGFILSSLE